MIKVTLILDDTSAELSDLEDEICDTVEDLGYFVSEIYAEEVEET